MNKDNIDKIIQVISNKPEHFAMEDYHSECGTMHCIGGWAENIAHEEGFEFASHDDDIISKVSEWLDVDGYIVRNLCLPDNRYAFDTLHPERRKEIAVKVLEKLRDTGRVTWDEHRQTNPWKLNDEI